MSRPGEPPAVVGRARSAARQAALWPELAGFALAGGAAYAVDLALFLWLRGTAGLGPLPAKALSFLAACTVAYLGNAIGTYRRHLARGPASPGPGGPGSGGGAVRRFLVFCVVNAAGAAVQLLCLAFSHYGLGLTSARADAVSGAGVGMVLATALRFWGTRTLVFRVRRGRNGEHGPSGHEC